MCLEQADGREQPAETDWRKIFQYELESVEEQ